MYVITLLVTKYTYILGVCHINLGPLPSMIHCLKGLLYCIIILLKSKLPVKQNDQTHCYQNHNQIIHNLTQAYDFKSLTKK